MKSTKIVRLVMKMYGRSTIYTNLYKTCRTVKCYAKDASDFKMIKDIQAMLTLCGIKCTAKRIVRSSRYDTCYRSGDSVIIRLPL